MRLDDIPLLRHASLLAGVLKVVAMLACFFLFPILVAVKFNDALRAQTRQARAYYALQTAAWFCIADAYSLLILSMLSNMLGHTGLSNSRHWLFFSRLVTDVQGFGLLFHELAMMSAIGGVAFVLSWCVGRESDDGQFLPRWNPPKESDHAANDRAY